MPVRSAYKTSLCFVSLGVVSIALANTQSGVTQLQPVVVQAPYHAIDTPWTTHTDRQALDDLQIQSWSDFGQRADPGVKFNPVRKASTSEDWTKAVSIRESTGYASLG